MHQKAMECYGQTEHIFILVSVELLCCSFCEMSHFWLLHTFCYILPAEGQKHS